MPMFYVKWEIHLEADTHEQAARDALRIHRDPRSIATAFDVAVQERRGRRNPKRIDLGAATRNSKSLAKTG